jgi:hypothetical protein
MFHESQLENVRNRIEKDLYNIEELGSRKIYLCWYDEFLIPASEYKGTYPCSDKTVDLREVIFIVKDIVKRPCIVSHNVIGYDPIPAFLLLQSETQSNCEKYVEVCLVT